MPDTSKPTRALATAVAGALGVAGLLGPLLAGAPPAEAATTATGATSVAATADAYVDAAHPDRTTGSATKLSAGTVAGTTKTSYLRFVVPKLPSGATLTSARLTLELLRASSGTPRVHATGGSWTESALSAATAPAVGTVLAAGTLAGATATFDVTAAARPGTTAHFAVTDPTAMSAFVAREAGAGAPALTLSWSVTTTTTAPPTTTTVPPTTTTTTAPRVTSAVRIGMSAPRDEWASRLAETGPVGARRLFGDLGGAAGMVSLARSELAAGRLPILSFKLPGDDWAGGAAGAYDPQLRGLATELDALPGQVFVTIHHEPAGDGAAEAYAAMQRHVLPILAAPSNVDAGVIVNGFWWSAKAQGLTDAEIARWLPADVLDLAEVVAADTYHGGTTAAPGEDAGAKIRRLSAWATRAGVERLGIGEYNGLDAAAIAAAGQAVLADPRYVFAAVFNSSENNREGVDWLLTGARLDAFRATLADAGA